MAYTVWERLVRADLGSDTADKTKVMGKAEEQFILAQVNSELAKMAITPDAYPIGRQDLSFRRHKKGKNV